MKVWNKCIRKKIGKKSYELRTREEVIIHDWRWSSRTWGFTKILRDDNILKQMGKNILITIIVVGFRDRNEE